MLLSSISSGPEPQPIGTNDRPQPNDTASNVTDTPDPSATSANPNGANASIATPQRSLAGPIAGGVVSTSSPEHD